MCKVLSENAPDSVKAYTSDELASSKLRENLFVLESLDQKMSGILHPEKDDQKEDVVKCSPSSAAGGDLGTENSDATESRLERGKSTSLSDGATNVSFSTSGTGPVSSSNGATDADMAEKEDEGTDEPGVVMKD